MDEICFKNYSTNYALAKSQNQQHFAINDTNNNNNKNEEISSNDDENFKNTNNKDLLINEQQKQIKNLKFNLEQIKCQRDYLIRILSLLKIDVNDLQLNSRFKNITNDDKLDNIEQNSMINVNNKTEDEPHSVEEMMINEEKIKKLTDQIHYKYAAIKIQNAYRQYKLRKNYLKLCENNLKRRSLDIDRLTITQQNGVTPKCESNRDYDDIDFNCMLIKSSNNDDHPNISDTTDGACCSAIVKVQSNSCSSVHSVYSNTTTISSSSSSSSASTSTSTSSIKTQSYLLNESASLTSIQQEQVIHTNGSVVLGAQPANKISKVTKIYDLKFSIGLNLFNRKPCDGIKYLCDNFYLYKTPYSVAHFLLNTKFLSKQMIGEYISNMHDEFCCLVLQEFFKMLNFKNLPLDEALREFQSHFRMTGEAQKIEYLTRTFSNYYIESNKDECKRVFNCAEETIEVLSYAIIMLNTLIHNPNIKQIDRMSFEQFVSQTRGIDNGYDINRDYLYNMYERVRLTEFKANKDHVNVVIEFEKTLVGMKKPTPTFTLPMSHRRLLCSVQLCEIYDLAKKEKINTHQRDVFLFNDLLIITKALSKKKSNDLYTYRTSFPLKSIDVFKFHTDHYLYGIRLIQLPEKRVLVTFNARNADDQKLFCQDLARAIAETNEVEAIQLRNETMKINVLSPPHTRKESCSSNGSSTVSSNRNKSESSLKQNTIAETPVTASQSTMKRTLSNSLLDMSTVNNEIYSQPIKLITPQNRTSSDCSLDTINSTSTRASLRQNNTDLDADRTLINLTGNDTLRPKSTMKRQYSILNRSSMQQSSHKYISSLTNTATSTSKTIDKSFRTMFKYMKLYHDK